MLFNYRLLSSQLFFSLFATRGTHLRLRPRRLRFLAAFSLLFPVMLLSSWIGFALDLLFYRRFRDIPVRSPVFIIGNFRSGSTFLHRLLTRSKLYYFNRYSIFRFILYFKLNTGKFTKIIFLSNLEIIINDFRRSKAYS